MILVIDVGGTSIKYGVAGKDGEFALLESVPTPQTTLEDFISGIRRIWKDMSRNYPIEAAAFSFPGEVHSVEGVIKGISAVSCIHNVPLKQMLMEHLGGIPVSMANDAKCAAMGELWRGVAKEHQNVVFVICGTGIGGAVIEQGKLYKGVTMNRGEFGNFPMGGFEDGIFLTWSDYTLEKQARKYGKMKNCHISGKDLDQLSGEGDELAVSLMKEFYYWMAVGCITLEFAFDPELIAIGGGISHNPGIVERIQRQADLLLDNQKSGYLRPRIKACVNGNRANLYGALYYYLHQDLMEGERKGE